MTTRHGDGEPAGKIRVLLADPQPSTRCGLRMRLALEPDLEVVGEAGDDATTLTLARSLQPAIILLDVSMPGADGVTATEFLLSGQPACRVVALTLCDDAETRARAEAAGVAAFVSKQGGDEALLAALRQVGARR